MKVVLLTGMSGAGKSHALEALEDIGYYCVDNMPPVLVSKFVELCQQSGGKISKIAIVTDIRGGELFEGILSFINEIRNMENIESQVIFLDASDSAIIRRYKETRRQHPLQEGGKIGITQSIKIEREKLKDLKMLSDVVIDTTMLKTVQLKNKISGIFEENNKGIAINVVSFGFKYGILSEADFVFDVRCLPNPFYVPELKHKTGLDEEVYNYVFDSSDTKKYIEKIKNMINFLLPLFIEEGKTSVILGIGCTGGKHRSVAIAENLMQYFKKEGFFTNSQHRDIQK